MVLTQPDNGLLRVPELGIRFHTTMVLTQQEDQDC